MSADVKVHILVADDDPDILNYFNAIFKGTHVLYLAADGVEAVQLAQKHKIDVAFIDINMPRLDGLQTLAQWKKIQPSTQIIIISSYSDGNMVRTAIKNGAFTYLFKPLNKMDIFSVTFKCLKNVGIEDIVSLQ
ncbi:response regulator [bacterium]|nr:response regulator [bacterium]